MIAGKVDPQIAKSTGADQNWGNSMKRTRRDLKRGAWKRLGFMLLAGLLSASAKAWGWGAVNGFCPTHQLILRQAYALLRTDGAFRGIPFPSIDDILSYEGVTAWRSHLLTVRATGPGPDADGATNYSDHYFNPAIGRGFAPAVVFHYFSLFLKGQGQDWAKSAAWASHFLSDMTVPHHVVGILKADAELVTQGLRPLTEADTGPPALYLKDPPAGWGGGGDFSAATRNYFEYQAADKADWYDPWYANGFGASASVQVGLSSHVSWEKLAHQDYQETWPAVPQPPDGSPITYDRAWRNAEIDPVFDTDIFSARSTTAGVYASRVAEGTRSGIVRYLRSPRDAIRRAISATATMWRASFSGLRPQLDLGSGLDPQNPSRVAVVLRVRNLASDTATRAVARLTIVYPNGQSQQILAQVADAIVPGSEGKAVWEIESRARGVHRLLAEVQASYRIPDLQYARTEKAIRLDAVETDDLAGLWQEESFSKTGARVMVVKVDRRGGELIGTIVRPQRIGSTQTTLLVGAGSFIGSGQEIFRLQKSGWNQYQGSVVSDVVPGVKIAGRGWVYNNQVSWRPCRAQYEQGSILKIFFTSYLFNSPQESMARFVRAR